MKNILFFYFIILLIISACQSKDLVHYDQNKPFAFNIKTINSDFTIEDKFLIYLPKGGKKMKVYPHDDRIYMEYKVTYKDGSVFYLSNDIWNGSRVNVENLYKIGIRGYTKNTPIDTLYFSGIQNDGRVWADNPLGEIVVGYANVPANKRDDFENSIRSLKRLQ